MIVLLLIAAVIYIAFKKPFDLPFLSSDKLPTWEDAARTLNRGDSRTQTVRQIRSSNHSLALDAVQTARTQGWLTDGTLAGATLRLANLPGADLRGANLAGANLSYADLSTARLTDADLADADLIPGQPATSQFGSGRSAWGTDGKRQSRGRFAGRRAL